MLFKLVMVVLIYIYSVGMKTFREANRNFENKEQIARIIDKMLEKDD